MMIGPKDHIKVRILHPSSKAQDREDSRNHGLQHPNVYLAVQAPKTTHDFEEQIEDAELDGAESLKATGTAPRLDDPGVCKAAQNTGTVWRP